MNEAYSLVARRRVEKQPSQPEDYDWRNTLRGRGEDVGSHQNCRSQVEIQK